MTDPQRDSNPRASFFSTAQGRIVTALGIIALVLGIAAEVISLRRNLAETGTSIQVSKNAEPRQEAETESAKQRRIIDTETAKQVAREAKARADEQEARACKTRVEAIIASTPLQDIVLPNCYYEYPETFGDVKAIALRDHSRTCVAWITDYLAAAPDSELAYRAYLSTNKAPYDKWRKDCDGSVLESYGKQITKAINDKQNNMKPDAGGDACLARAKKWLASAPKEVTAFLDYLSGAEYEDIKSNCFPKMNKAQRDEVLSLYNAATLALTTAGKAK